jgi:hypothetical protein
MGCPECRWRCDESSCHPSLFAWSGDKGRLKRDRTSTGAGHDGDVVADLLHVPPFSRSSPSNRTLYPGRTLTEAVGCTRVADGAPIGERRGSLHRAGETVRRQRNGVSMTVGGYRLGGDVGDRASLRRLLRSTQVIVSQSGCAGILGTDRIEGWSPHRRVSGISHLGGRQECTESVR